MKALHLLLFEIFVVALRPSVRYPSVASTLPLLLSRYGLPRKLREMGKGAAAEDTRMEAEAENMAAWLVSINTLKIQPFKLPPLGCFSLSSSYDLSHMCLLGTLPDDDQDRSSDELDFESKRVLKTPHFYYDHDPSGRRSGSRNSDPTRPHDVKVRMKAVGICGSDVRYVKAMRSADFVVKEPMVIGHECAGIIEEVGSEVKNLAVGDRVALEPGIGCSRCKQCKNGDYNLCPDMKFFATPPVHGSLANQVVHPADLCFKLPDNVSLEEGAMCEPLSVGIHACRRARVGPETNILIMGAGPIGMVTMLAARAFGAPRIVMVDISDHRLSVAKKLGADEIVKVTANVQDLDEEVVQIQKAMGTDVDVTFDCAGFSKTMSAALSATRSGGKVCLIGSGHREFTVPLTPATNREVDILCIFRYKNTWPLCLELLRTGKIDVKPLITHRFGFSQKEVEEAFETSAHGNDAIKVMFNL